MPYKTIWVKPGVFMTHKGVNVYHVYKDDEIEQGERQFRFTLDPTAGEFNSDFDVRKLSTYDNGAGHTTAAIKAAIRKAIASGELP